MNTLKAFLYQHQNADNILLGVGVDRQAHACFQVFFRSEMSVADKIASIKQLAMRWWDIPTNQPQFFLQDYHSQIPILVDASMRLEEACKLTVVVTSHQLNLNLPYFSEQTWTRLD